MHAISRITRQSAIGTAETAVGPLVLRIAQQEV